MNNKNLIKMTVVSWFPENFCVNPFFNTQYCEGGGVGIKNWGRIACNKKVTEWREGLKCQEKLVMSFMDGPFHRDHLKRAQLITRSFSQFCANIFLHNLFCIVMTVSFFQRSFNPKAFLKFLCYSCNTHIYFWTDISWWLTGINEQFGDLFSKQLTQVTGTKYMFWK